MVKGVKVRMLKRGIHKLLKYSAEHKKVFILPTICVILMTIVISFSQIVMEIYAYTFITNQNVENRNLEKLLEFQRAEDASKNKQSEQSVKKVNNHTKNTDDKSVDVDNPGVGDENAESLVFSFVKPLEGGVTSSVFGDTVSRTAKHLGHDWAVDVGTKVMASAAGVVDRAYYSDSYGYNILINHGNGIKTRYAHLSEICVVAGGQVEQSQIIGYSGNTGDSTGPHLHFEVIVNGKCCNPIHYIQ